MPKVVTRGAYMNDSERLRMLLNEPWIDLTTIGSYRVHCRGCGGRIALDKRSGKFYAANLHKHLKRCRTIRKANAGEPWNYADLSTYQKLTEEDMEMDEKEEKSKKGVYCPYWQQWLMDKGVVRNTLRFAPTGWEERRHASHRESSVASSTPSESSTVVDTQNNREATSETKVDVASPLVTEDDIQAALILVRWKRMRNVMLNEESTTSV